MHPAVTATEIAIIYSPEFAAHNTGLQHPENAGRLQAVQAALQQASWSEHLRWQAPTPVSQRDVRPWITRLHSQRYVEALEQLCAQGGGRIDGDTPVSAESFRVAQLAVSAWLDGVDEVQRTGQGAFVLARPPGHHAVAERGMGFCLFSNAAIAAHYALEHHGVERVAILDWDVHHGNGTQALVEAHPQIVYCSLHQSPGYPGTGYGEERGRYGNVLNLPMAPGCTGADYRQAFTAEVLPFLKRSDCQLLIVSAGYDATEADPLASMGLQPADYGDFTRYCREITDRIVFGLEGGYDYGALGASVAATLAAYLDS